MKLIQKYGYLFRRMRLVHYLHNWMNRDALAYLKPMYRKAGLQKSVLSSISHKDFKKHALPETLPWLDRPEALSAINQRQEEWDAETETRLKQWVEKGYLVLEKGVPETLVDGINQDVEHIIERGLLPFHFSNTRVMNCILHSEALKQLVKSPILERWLPLLLGRKVKPFQTMNFLVGSKARAHSDTIHMTTEPLGYLIAIWVALEDIHPDSGPVFYYPGSHKLPYVLSKGFDTGNTSLTVGKHYYENYLDHIEEMMEKEGYEKEVLIAKKGDILIWHGNLIHGGTPVINPELSRKSLVIHYFAEDVICYHELTQRPAIPVI
ncbi:MAG: phytanoyl-CoA dioxygenase family protein [Salibacteraceae bacterium]